MWMTEMLLGLLEINFMAIRASTRPDDRVRITRQFNNKNNSTLVLLTTFRMCSLGINLQSSCHQMVVLETARNINTLLQAIGRIHGIGQTRQQYVKILFCDHTFNRWQEYMCTKKFMAQLSGSNWGSEASQDTIMQLLGQPVPRLPMRELDFSQVDDPLADGESSDGDEEWSDGAGDGAGDEDEHEDEDDKMEL
jgi:SNF2 family DNA or RNA helicase